jgi:saccharopine dehydrogenase-like NADP-dependent oxidoreductase
MTTILILGGYGVTGKLLTRTLLEQTDTKIIVAGRHLGKAQLFANHLNTKYKTARISALYADAASKQSLKNALKRADFLLVASPTTKYADNVIRAALESGVDYLDIQLSSEKLELLKAYAPEIERAGRCFITEAGYHPGLPAALVRYAAQHYDRLEEADTACYLNMGPTAPYSESLDELMDAFRHYQAHVFRDGEWTPPKKVVQRKFDFGKGIGVKNCYSMYFEELGELPREIPTLLDAGFYMSGTHWFVDWFVYPLIFWGLKLPLSFLSRPLGKLFWGCLRFFAKAPYLVMLKVDSKGVKNGKPLRVETTVSHPDGYALTAIPVVATLLQYLDGTAKRPGLWMMGYVVEPSRLLADMKRMGVSITEQAYE